MQCVRLQVAAMPRRSLLLVSLLLACAGSPPPDGRDPRPNILLIVADDLGYSDLGVYGGEIPTPNLDALAQLGVLARDFHVAPRGAPSRAMLLTGVDNHTAGFGSSALHLAPNQEGERGYELVLPPDVVTVASLLEDAGYYTVAAGKWELGDAPEDLPAARGFERSFVLHDAAASHWSDMKSAVPGRRRARFTRNGQEVAELPADYFSSRYFADFVTEGIEDADRERRPFFAYLSFQAPHGPLAREGAAPSDGRYDAGYEATVAARLLHMKERNLLREDVKAHPGLPTVPRWSELDDDQKRRQIRKMELYAWMVEDMDSQIGRVLDRLRELGVYDNTWIVFLSDNGPEPADRGLAGMEEKDRAFYAEQFPVAKFDRWGSPGSFVEYGAAWAEVSSTPFRLFKGTLAEGGTRSPLIVSGPGVAASKRWGGQRISEGILHVTDLTPTFLEIAQVTHPTRFRGETVAPLHGKSLVQHFSGGYRGWRARHGPHEWIASAFDGGRSVRREEWKMLWIPKPFGPGKWSLHRLDRDPIEIWDRMEHEEEEAAELLELWEGYAARNGVVLPEAPMSSVGAP